MEKARPLAHGYSSEITRCHEERWRELLNNFDDANLYQTWPYDAIRQGEANLRHCVVSKSGRVVGVAQARLRLLPAARIGAAYVRWGPLWRRRDSAADPMDFRMVLRALRNELVLKRGLFLRVYPHGFNGESTDYRSILEEEGFSAAPEEVPQRTLLLSLEPSLEEIRKNFDHKWRNCLSKAERNGLECVEGADDDLFGAFMELYRALLARKKFKEPNDISQFRRVQRRLANDQKMRVFLTGKDGSHSCGGICTGIGTTGVYLFGACNESGMTTNGSYLIQWKIIQWLKQQGCRQYNLNGLNPERNPGTYHFKAGIAGKTRREAQYIGRFDTFAGSATATGIHAINRAYLRCKSLLAQATQST
jgi:hypothetical protein